MPSQRVTVCVGVRPDVLDGNGQVQTPEPDDWVTGLIVLNSFRWTDELETGSRVLSEDLENFLLTPRGQERLTPSEVKNCWSRLTAHGPTAESWGFLVAASFMFIL